MHAVHSTAFQSYLYCMSDLNRDKLYYIIVFVKAIKLWI